MVTDGKPASWLSVPMAPLSTEDAIAFLQKTNSTNGDSVFEHLTKVLARVLDEKPNNAVDVLETSVLVKKTAYYPKAAGPKVPTTSSADAAKAVAGAVLFGTPDLPIDPETGEPVEAEAPNEFEAEDILGDAHILDAVGAGLGRGEMHAVMLAAKKLGEDPKRGVATVRFFGKFLGTHADYYVFETTLQTPPEEPEEVLAPGQAPMEAVGSGANACVYFACNHLGGPLTQLPTVKPAHIKAARAIKKLLTGRLSSAVSAYPLFPGNEAAYLRAQIARIAHATVVAPGGMFAAGEEDAIEKAEGWEPAPAREYALPANWAHRLGHLKKQGRTKVFKPEAEEGAEEKEPTEEEAEEDPGALAALEADAEVEGGPAWAPLFSSSSEQVKHQAGGMRSLRWPGAVCAAQGARFTNLYVGYGLKNAPFVPLPPPPVAKEFDAGLVESSELPPKPAPPAEEEAAE